MTDVGYDGDMVYTMTSGAGKNGLVSDPAQGFGRSSSEQEVSSFEHYVVLQILHRTRFERQVDVPSFVGVLISGSTRRRDSHHHGRSRGRAMPTHDASGFRRREQPTCEAPSFPQASTPHDSNLDLYDNASACAQGGTPSEVFRWLKAAEGPKVHRKDISDAGPGFVMLERKLACALLGGELKRIAAG